MGILDKVRAVQARHPTGAELVGHVDDRLGYDQSNFSPSEYGDYIATSADVYACVSLRARLVSELDLKLYRGEGPEKQEVTPSDPAASVLRRVNPFWNPARLARMDEICMGLWGETFWALEPDRSGQPSEIWWMKPDRVRPVPSSRGYLKGYLYEPADGGPAIPFRADEVVWFRYPNPLDEFSPLSPLAAARLSADTSSSMMKANHNLFRNGLHTGGFVRPVKDKVSFSKEQAEELEVLLDRRLKGVDKAHRWAVLRFEAEFDKVNLSPKDAEWADGLNITLRQTANAYGIPVPLLNDMEHATLANAREYERILWTNALKPDSKLRSDEIKEQFLPRFDSQRRADHCEYNFGAVAALQESMTEAWSRERQAIEVGGLTINEWRKSKGMDTVPWGDVWWAPVNKQPVEDPETFVRDMNADGVPDEEQGQAGMSTRQAALIATLIASELDQYAHSNGNGAGH